MIQALTAIQAKFNASATLTTRFPNGMYHGNAADNQALPTCRLTRVSAVRDYNTVNRITTYRIQIDVFARVDANGETFVQEAIAELMAVFDFCTLNLTGFMEMRSVNDQAMQEDEETWHGFVEYEVWVTE